MATYEFEVRQVATALGRHSWEVHERASGSVFPLPEGGTGSLLGSYPEIAQHLFNHHGQEHDLTYDQGTDRFSPDYRNGVFEWRFLRGGDTIIVRDIPRVIAFVRAG